jgi:hypothetical protein
VVRLSADLVRAAAATEKEREIHAFLAESLQGAVFMDGHTQRYYVLVPEHTRLRPEWRSPSPLLGTALLGRESVVGVPPPDAADPSETRCHWCVPMDDRRTLADPAAVLALAVAGLRKQAERDAAESVSSATPAPAA